MLLIVKFERKDLSGLNVVKDVRFCFVFCLHDSYCFHEMSIEENMFH